MIDLVPAEHDDVAFLAVVQRVINGFLDAQGLGWLHDLQAAEDAGMVVRIPIASLPTQPPDGSGQSDVRSRTVPQLPSSGTGGPASVTVKVSPS